MLTPEASDLLKDVQATLSQPDPYPTTVSDADQNAWISREEAESALAGLIDTRLALGHVDSVALEQARSLVTKGGTRAHAAKVAEVFDVLAQGR